MFGTSSIHPQEDSCKRIFGMACLHALDETKYMVMSRDQNAGRIHNIRLIIVPLQKWKSSDIWE